MPRISDQQRAHNRQVVVDAAVRCFSRNGFQQTSMPDIAAEANVATGTPYRYISDKQQLVVEVAHMAFAAVFDPVLAQARDSDEPPQIVELIGRALRPDAADSAITAETSPELLRCAVDSWGEILRNEDLREHANAGVAEVMATIEDALRRGQEAGTVPQRVQPASFARLVVVLIHGLVLHRTAFGLDDTARVLDDLQALIDDTDTTDTTRE